MSNIPVTVITGYLGSGKTTIILNLIKQLQDDYNVVWLKNEYGNLSIDSELAKENNIEVKEMLNGCLCCVLVGKLKEALKEIVRDYHPDRIIIESSGTAFPLPIVLEINEIPELSTDGVINVIDALNFPGYHDKSVAARMQTKCTDLTIINKVGLVDEAKLDQVLDEVYDLNPHTPLIRTANGSVGKELLLGLDSKLVGVGSQELGAGNLPAANSHLPASESHHHSHEDEVEAFEFYSGQAFDLEKIERVLTPLRDKDFIRIKGVIFGRGDTYSQPKFWLLNWVFGRVSWEELAHYSGDTKMVFMGRDGIGVLEKKIRNDLQNCTF